MPIKDSITLDEAIEILNEAVEADSDAMGFLITNRVACNDSLRKHPTIQVALFNEQSYTVGLLGILNGLFGIDEKGWGAIAAVFDEDKKLLKFERRANLLTCESSPK